MQYGFDSAAIGSLQAMPGFLKVFGFPDESNPIGYGIDSIVQQLISSLLTLGSFLSSLAAGPFSTYLGRREGLWVACALNAISCAIQLATVNHGVLYLGRLLMGLSNGFLVTFSNVYIAEAAPANLRGVMVALFAYWVNIGSIIGTVVTKYTSKRLDKSSYQTPIACLYIVPVVLAVGLFFVPESPRWLLHKRKDAEAREALTRLRAQYSSEATFEYEWAEMVRGTEKERSTNQSIGFFDMFKGSHAHWVAVHTLLTLIQVLTFAEHSCATASSQARRLAGSGSSLLTKHIFSAYLVSRKVSSSRS